jgi:hypothetical protein
MPPTSEQPLNSNEISENPPDDQFDDPPWYPWLLDPQEDGVYLLTEIDPGIKRFLPYTDDQVKIDLDLGITREDALADLALQELS